MGVRASTVMNLRQVLASNDARIILSSDWRFGHSLEEMLRFLRHHRLDPFFEGFLPSPARYSSKKADITRYLEEHPELTRYAIVDDANMYDVFGDHFVSTRFSDCLDVACAERVDYILRHGPWWQDVESAERCVVRDGLRKVVIVEGETVQDALFAVSCAPELHEGAGLVLAGAAAAEYLSTRKGEGLVLQMRSLFSDRIEEYRIRVDGAIRGGWNKTGQDYLPDKVSDWLLRRPALEWFSIVSAQEPDAWGDRFKDSYVPLRA